MAQAFSVCAELPTYIFIFPIRGNRKDIIPEKFFDKRLSGFLFPRLKYARRDLFCDSLVNPRLLKTAKFYMPRSICMNERTLNELSSMSKTESLVRYGVQLAMLNKLLALGMVSAKEHSAIKSRLMSDYKITPLNSLQ
jgi:hypothetical protein